MDWFLWLCCLAEMVWIDSVPGAVGFSGTADEAGKGRGGTSAHWISYDVWHLVGVRCRNDSFPFSRLWTDQDTWLSVWGGSPLLHLQNLPLLVWFINMRMDRVSRKWPLHCCMKQSSSVKWREENIFVSEKVSTFFFFFLIESHFNLSVSVVNQDVRVTLSLSCTKYKISI